MAVNTQTIEQRTLLPEAKQGLSMQMRCSESSAIIVLTDGTVYQLDLSSGILGKPAQLIVKTAAERFLLNRSTLPIDLQPIWLRDNTLLLASHNQLYTATLSTGVIRPFAAPLPAPITVLNIRPNGTLWIGTKGAGIYHLSNRGEILQSFTSKNGGLADDNVDDLAFSSNDMMFVLSGHQLQQLSSRPTGFVYQVNTTGNNSWYAAAFGTEQTWLISAFAGLWRLDEQSLQLTDFSAKLREQLQLAGDGREPYISAAHIHQNELWLSSNNALVRLNQQSGQAQVFDRQRSELDAPLSRVRHIFTDSQQRLWLTDRGSLLQFLPAETRFQRWSLQNTTLPDRKKRFVKVAEDPQQRIWALGELGLYLATADQQLQQQFAYTGRGFLRDFTIDAQGRIWLLGPGELIRLTIAQGVVDERVYSFSERNDAVMESLIAWREQIWVGTREGLSMFDVKTEQWRHFVTGDGINAKSAHQRGAYQRGDKLVFMTEDGILSFNPADIPTTAHSTVLSALQVRTGTGAWRHQPLGQTLEMAESDHWLEFKIDAVEFRYPEQLRFRYMLQGYDPDWDRSSTSQLRAFAGVPAGHYQLKAELFYQHNGEVVAQLNLPVTILPPWYRTNMAIAGYTLAAFAALLAFYRIRQRRVAEIIRYETEIAATMQRAVQAQQRQQELTLLDKLGRQLTGQLDLCRLWQDFVRAAAELAPVQRALLIGDAASLLDLPAATQQEPTIYSSTALPANLQQLLQLPADTAVALADLPSPCTTALKLPLARQQDYGAVILLAEYKDTFDDSTISLLKMLTEFMVVALDNIASYQRMQVLQAQVQQQQKVQSLNRLVAGMAHEMNTPTGTAITATSMVSDLLHQTGTKLDSGQLSKTMLLQMLHDAQQATVLAQNNVQRLSEMTAQFKLLASAHSQRNFSDVDVWMLLRQLAAITQSNHPQIKLHLHLPTQPLLLFTCKSALELVFQHLIDNVFLHAAANRDAVQLTGTVNFVADSIQLWFCDDGPGLQQTSPEQVFEPFYTTARYQGRIGLGLSVVHNLVTDVLGGTITLQNGPTGGCCLQLTLPLSAPLSRH